MSLSKLVLSLPMERTGFALLELGPDVGVRFPHMDRMGVHYILSGEVDLETADDPSQRLTAGDFVCVPRGAAHGLSGIRASRSQKTNWLQKLEAQEEPVRLRLGRNPEQGATILSGSVNIRYTAGGYTVPTLPDVIVLRPGSDRAASFLPPAVCGAALTGAGAGAFAAALVQALFTQAVRSCVLESIIVQQPHIQAFRFPRVASAHRLIERHYAEPWTVSALADAAGMAKSTFVAAFTAATGDPPSVRLTKIRLSHAKRLLASPRSMGAIGQAVGYRSQAAFTRAFRRHYGETPSAARQRLRQHPDDGLPDGGIEPPSPPGLKKR